MHFAADNSYLFSEELVHAAGLIKSGMNRIVLEQIRKM
ncbi:hypothetical protein C240_2352 [Enterococcus sp. 5H]|nr:hypothetical protein [Enterococcus sp. 5H]